MCDGPCWAGDVKSAETAVVIYLQGYEEMAFRGLVGSSSKMLV
jgi:hypothetical protein